MKIKKGQKLKIKHRRIGTFYAIAKEDFDTKREQSYPVVAAESPVEGIVNVWISGDEIPCLSRLVESIEVVS